MGNKKNNHASFITQSLVLTKRSFTNMYRDLGYYWLRLAIYLILAFGLGTLYYNIGFNFESIQVCIEREKREKDRHWKIFYPHYKSNIINLYEFLTN